MYNKYTTCKKTSHHQKYCQKFA